MLLILSLWNIYVCKFHLRKFSTLVALADILLMYWEKDIVIVNINPRQECRFTLDIGWSLRVYVKIDGDNIP